MAGAIPPTQPALPVCGAVALVTAMPLVLGGLAVLLCFFYSPAASVTPVGLYCAPVPFVPLTPVAPLEPPHFFYRPTSSVVPLCAPTFRGRFWASQGPPVNDTPPYGALSSKTLGGWAFAHLLGQSEEHQS